MMGIMAEIALRGIRFGLRSGGVRNDLPGWD